MVFRSSAHWTSKTAMHPAFELSNHQSVGRNEETVEKGSACLSSAVVNACETQLADVPGQVPYRHAWHIRRQQHQTFQIRLPFRSFTSVSTHISVITSQYFCFP